MSTTPPDAPFIDADAEDTNTLPAVVTQTMVPATLNELAARTDDALAIIDTRIRVINTVRGASIAMTHPEDWVLFKAKDGRVVGYLEDVGCNRVRDLFGISVYNVGNYEKVAGSTPEDFTYFLRGDGRCSITGQVLEGIEGARSSTDDVGKGKVGAQLDITVRKSTRANLDGNITRRLAGLQSIPVEELDAAWKGTAKKSAHCRLGRGFGSQAERQGAEIRQAQQPPDVTPPTCKVCGATMQFKPAGQSTSGTNYDAFWSCPDRNTKHKDQKSAINDSDWRKELADRAAAAATPREPSPAAATTPREPGEDG